MKPYSLLFANRIVWSGHIYQEGRPIAVYSRLREFMGTTIFRCSHELHEGAEISVDGVALVVVNVQPLWEMEDVVQHPSYKGIYSIGARSLSFLKSEQR